jgi:dTDP-4-dehydrorhamnose reductase
MDAKVLVTGHDGQLGFDVVRCLERRGVACRGVDIADFDLTDGEATAAYLSAYRPTVVVHCAAFTAVDAAEDKPETCFLVNATGSGNIAGAARDVGAGLIYISTDYVFSGDGETPFETDAHQDPKNIYGTSKAWGEDEVRRILPDRHSIVRISWVFGLHGKSSFVKTMLRLGRERADVSVVSDQIGSPTYTADVAEFLADLIESGKYGEFHATNEGFCSWAEFAEAIFEEAGLPTKVRSITTEEYPTRAARPKNSRLSKASLDAAGFHRLPPWRDALRRHMKELECPGC